MSCVQHLKLCPRMARCPAVLPITLPTWKYRENIVQIQACQRRTYSTTEAQHDPQTRDLVGPPNPKSNLRLISFHQPADETPEERLYREMREGVQEWNHDFWTVHNASFIEEKERYITEKLREKNIAGAGNEAMTSDEMSVFYKKFLNDNYKKHLNYNKEWHRKNIGLLWPGIRAVMSRWKKNVFRE